jgi:ribosomal protein S18 acetylase RimI-like enzyme
MHLSLRVASEGDLASLVPFVSRYHEFELIVRSHSEREQALLPLLRDSSLGLVWLIFAEDTLIGYIAICFCYSIEHGGRESFIDEFFIDEMYRGRGYGNHTLDLVAQDLSHREARAISLEVAHSNQPAKDFYTKAGFEPRARYSLMTRLLKTEQGTAANP